MLFATSVCLKLVPTGFFLLPAPFENDWVVPEYVLTAVAPYAAVAPAASVNNAARMIIFRLKSLSFGLGRFFWFCEQAPAALMAVV